MIKFIENHILRIISKKKKSCSWSDRLRHRQIGRVREGDRVREIERVKYRDREIEIGRVSYRETIID